MPTYSFVCESCDHKFDQMQTMQDVALKTCPVCGKQTLKRLIGRGAGLIFKGSGFYINDYARKSGNESNGSSSSKSNGRSSDSSKTEKKKSESQGKSTAESKTD
ncbi:FmdB family zinc ribbon protein [Candidatus Neomarinimicrobiota bacterium]